MIKSRKKQETLSDKISSVLFTAPTTFDPEDDVHDVTTAKIVNADAEDIYNEDADDVGVSKLRKQNLELLENVDKRYSGKKVSRKSLKESDDDWSTEDEGLSTDEGEALDGEEGTQELASDESESVEDESESDFNDDEDETIQEDNFKHMSEINVSNQAKKGACVKHQLNIWENLLEMRIQLQKCLIQSNKMPQYELFNNFKSSDVNFKHEVKNTTRNVQNVLEKFLQLQTLLLKQYPDTKSLLKEDKNQKKQQQENEESDEEIPSDSDEEMKSEHEEEDEEKEVIPKKRRKLLEIEQDITTRHNKYEEYRNSIIQKWNDKTRLTIGKNAGTNSIIQHINFILDDKQKLIKRTQLKRSDYQIIGKVKPETPTTSDVELQQTTSKLPDEYDTEIYDDDDFYHQLLRELIEFKSTGITDPVQMSRQWIQLQNLRSKMKRKIDTKATKGRKIRYAIHSKLVNYMAPIDFSTMTEEAKNELYSSLFGKRL